MHFRNLDSKLVDDEQLSDLVANSNVTDHADIELVPDLVDIVVAVPKSM